MKFLDKIISKIAVLFLALVSIVFILLPFDAINYLSTNNIINFVQIIKSNYLYSIGAVVILIFSIKALFSELFNNRNRQNHILSHMNFGDLRISDEAIEGLTQNTISKIIGIRSSRIVVGFSDGYIILKIRGEVSPDINIPEVTNQIQNQVKDTIEKHTGIPVSQVNVDILSISSPMKTLK